MECIIRTETHAVTYNCVTGERKQSVHLPKFGKLRGFYSRNGKSHKNVGSGWAHRWPFL